MTMLRPAQAASATVIEQRLLGRGDFAASRDGFDRERPSVVFAFNVISAKQRKDWVPLIDRTGSGRLVEDHRT